jgi:hypothetical protein
MPIDFRAFPPELHRKRIDNYARYEKLFLGQHRELYAAQPGKHQKARYIAVNFPGMISRLCADLLFGEQPDFSATEDAAQEALDNLVERNNLHTLNYESALGNSFRGDAIYKVRWGKRTPQAELPESIIEEAPPAIYYPELDEDDVRRVIRVTLAWLKIDPANPQLRYLRIEEHEPGIIRNRLLRFGDRGATQEEMPLTTFPAYEGLELEVETGLKVIPIFHAPNFVYGSRFWGISDYEGLEPLFEAVNDRVTQSDEVLAKHVAPKLVVPPRFVDEDGKVKLSELEVVQLDPGEPAPTYVTWDAHLTAASEHTERLMDLIFIISETAPAAFGVAKYGVAESGRALRLRLLRTLAKVNRKRLYYDRALKGALLCAQQLEVIHGGASYEPEEPVIGWADGLPEDMFEQAQIEAARLAAGNTSLESSIRRLDGPDAVDAEMERIAEDLGQATALTGQG